MDDFTLIPFDTTNEHKVLEKALIKALLEFHQQYGRTARKRLDISIALSAVKILVHLNNALNEAGLKIVKNNGK
jgi:hypothetical protein